MADGEQAPTVRLEVAQTRAPRAASTPRADDRLAVPARPAAVTAANVAVLVGTGAAAVGGPIGWVAGGAVALAGAEVARRTVQRRATRHAERSAAGGRTGGRVARRTGPGGGDPTARGGRHGTKGGGQLRRAARRVGAVTADHPIGRAAKAAAGSKAGRATRKAANAAGKRAAKAAKALGGGASRAAKGAKTAARKAVRRSTGKGAGADRTRPNKPHHKGGPVDDRKTRPIVDRPTDAARKPAPGQAPTPDQVPAKGRPMANGNGNAAQQKVVGTSVLWQAARRLRETAAAYRPRGMLEVRAEAYEMPLTLAEVAQAMADRAAANSRESLDPALQQLYRSLAETLSSAAVAARQLGPAFDSLHAERVNDLLRGNNPRGWDAANNGRG